MRFDPRSEPLDLERGLPTTEQDMIVLRRLKARPRVSTREYLRFLAWLAPRTTEALRSRPGPQGEPFRL